MSPIPARRLPAARRPIAYLCAALALLGLTAAAFAQTLPSPYTSASRFDPAGRLAGTIDPDPGTGTPVFAAVRNSYDGAGRLIRIERGRLSAWQAHSITPAGWSGFTILQTVEMSYDAAGRKLKDELWAGGAREAVTQYSHDSVGRLECTAVRMNQAAFGALPASACTLGPPGNEGPDRITRNVYDSAGQLTTVERAYGVTTANGFPATLQQNYARFEYTLNGKRKAVIDANGNRAEMTWDAYDRQTRWIFPTSTLPAGDANPGDYEEYGYDPNGNRTSLRKRDESVLTYQYDALNRMAVKFVPERAGLTAAQTRDVHYEYDLRGLQTRARFDSLAGEGVTSVYDGFGQLLSSTLAMAGTSRALSYGYDAGGNRKTVTHPDGNQAVYDYDRLDRMTAYRENGWLQLATLTYDAAGRRSGLAMPAAATGYGHDGLSRLTSLTHDLAGTTQDQSLGFSYNRASQIQTRTTANGAYAWGGAYNVSRPYSVNGLNQYTSAGGASFDYDPNGNLVSDGTRSYVYDVENRLVSASGATTAAFVYDPLGRLFQTSGGAAGVTQFLYAGDELTSEFGATGTILRRYVHGAGADDPLFWYEGAEDGDRRSLLADHQGSIVASVSGLGAAVTINSYDPWGIPGANNAGRFGYTGQAWIPELGMWHYKARIYSPTLGRFLQTDPVGYEDQVNLYAYVGNDPVNSVDPSGKFRCYRTPTGQHCISDGSFRDNIAVLAYKFMVEAGIISMHDGTDPPFTDLPGNKRPDKGDPDSTVRGGTGSRTYGPDGWPLIDRDTPHPDEKGPGCGDHCHDWGRPEGGGRPTHEDRGPARFPRPGDPPVPRGPNVPPPTAPPVPDIKPPPPPPLPKLPF